MFWDFGALGFEGSKLEGLKVLVVFTRAHKVTVSLLQGLDH